MTRSWRCVWVLGVALLVGGAERASGATALQKCAGSKAKAFGVAVKLTARCHATARRKGRAVDRECVQKVERKLRKQVSKAERKVACPGDVEESIAGTSACVAGFDDAMAGDAACVARKLKAAGKKAAGKSACAKKAALRGTAVDAACLAKVERTFAKAMAKADRKGTCAGTAAEVGTLVDACLAAVPVAVPCEGGTGFATCDGTCPNGLACRPWEVFEDGASVETGCSCVDVIAGPECSGTTCGTDRQCPDPTHVCERWLEGDPTGCDHMICQPALTTPTTLPTREPLECDGGEFPTCGGTCPAGERCQPAQALLLGYTLFAGCICTDPRGPRCEMPTDCDFEILPFSHCADPTKVCLVTVVGEDANNPSCSGARCGDPLPVVLPPTSTTSTSTSTTSSTTSATSSSTSTTTTTSTSTSTTMLCVSTPGTSGCFTDLGDCTILDTCTGLQWEQKTATPGLHDVTNLYTWSGCCDHDCSTVESHCQPNAAASATCLALADHGTEGCGLCTSGTCFVDPFNRGAITTIWDWLNQLNASGFAGHSDWRVPRETGLSVGGGDRELESILLMPYPCATSPCVDPIFGPTMADIYWTATTKGPTGPDRPSDAWFVGFADGGWGDAGKWGHLYVWAVR